MFYFVLVVTTVIILIIPYFRYQQLYFVYYAQKHSILLFTLIEGTFVVLSYISLVYIYLSNFYVLYLLIVVYDSGSSSSSFPDFVSLSTLPFFLFLLPPDSLHLSSLNFFIIYFLMVLFPLYLWNLAFPCMLRFFSLFWIRSCILSSLRDFKVSHIYYQFLSS